MVVPELDEQLRGTRPGAILEFTATLPERFGERAGEDATFRVIVKEAKQKVLPELTDEWVDEASEFDTVDELRADIRQRLETDAAAAGADGDCATRCSKRSPISCRSPRRRRSSTTRRAGASKISRTGCRTRTRRSSSTSRPPARSRRRSSTRSATARPGPCSPIWRCARSSRKRPSRSTDDEVDAEVERLAERLEQKVEKVRRDLERRGVLETVRSDLARGKALEFLIDHATVVDEEGNVIDLTVPDEPPSSDAADRRYDERTSRCTTSPPRTSPPDEKGPEA